MVEKLLSTGLPLIDKELGGGLYPGSLVYLSADSKSMAEVFLYHFLQNTPTYYMTTERKPEFIIRNIERLGISASGVKFIDVHQKYYENAAILIDRGRSANDYMIIDYLKRALEGINDKDVNLIIDTITFFLYLDIKRALIRELIDIIYTTIKRIGGLGFLYGIKDDPRPIFENEVINRCDVVFDISMVMKTDKIVTEFMIPKARDRPIYGNIKKFKVEGGIILDTSEEIV